MITRNEDHERDGSQAARAADTAVRQALVEGHRDLLAFLHRRLGSREEAQEALQRFAVRALERASDIRDVQTLRGWLSRVLATTIADHQRRAIRRRRREVTLEQECLQIVSEAITPDPEVDKVVCDCLHKLLPTLKSDYADIIWRADILGEPRERIAASLGTTLNNVSVRLHRGRQALKKRLEEMCLTCAVHGFLECTCDEAERIRDMRTKEQQQAKSSGVEGP